MLTATKTDLEMERAILSEKRLRCYRSIGWRRYLWEQIVDQILLLCAQRLTDATAIEPAKRGRVAFLECTHNGSALGVCTGACPALKLSMQLQFSA